MVVMTRSPTTPETRYAAVVASMLQHRGVSQSTKKGFGSSALVVNGSIFAMLSSKRRFVVKLPRRRVDVLVAAGVGERFDPGRGRLMKEWLSLKPASTAEWESLAREAMAYVAAGR